MQRATAGASRSACFKKRKMPARRTSGRRAPAAYFFPHVCSGGQPGRRFRCGQELTMSESSQPNPLATDADQADAPGGFPSVRAQTIVGAGVLLVAAGLAFGALQIPSDSGYGGVGPNFLPWLCAVVLAVCGAWLVWEARTGGFREASAGGGHPRADIGAFVWVSAGLLVNAALIGTVGFIVSCTVCYVLAVQGLGRGHRAADLGARVLGLHAIPGDQPAGPD
jgi:putative tricarboxylic transport membrane protein